MTSEKTGSFFHRIESSADCQPASSRFNEGVQMEKPHQITKQGIRIGVRAAIIRDGALLLVAFDDETGFHYNLPGGGVEPGETLYDTARREVREETAAEVEVKELLLVYECNPPDYGFSEDEDVHSLGFVFRCELLEGSEPRLPETADPHQIAVDWIPLDEFPDAALVPRIQHRIIVALNGAQKDPFYMNPDITDEIRSLK
jgi:ADP-ribose pyrophosphatase YjhB (NUDIX family)